MVSNGTKKGKMITSMLVLSVVTPAGVVLGLVLTVHGQGDNRYD